VYFRGEFASWYSPQRRSVARSKREMLRMRRVLEKRLVSVLVFLEPGSPGSPEVVCDIFFGISRIGDSLMFCDEFICFVATKRIGEAEVELLAIQSLGILDHHFSRHQKSRSIYVVADEIKLLVNLKRK
jgi:hypothetical protein